MKTTAAILLAALALSACAGQQTGKFYKDGATAQEYATDAYACERDTLAVASPYTFGRGFTAGGNARGFAIRCMAARGYRYR
jgi:uncharacterized protein YbjT (DUF2867 family)